MPTELRQIAFEPTEICAAIQDYKRRRAETLPPGSIVGASFGNGADMTTTPNIKNNEGDATTAITLSGEAVAAALILYCINRKIPLPAKAEKKLQHSGDGLCLMIKQAFKPGSR